MYQVTYYVIHPFRALFLTTMNDAFDDDQIARYVVQWHGYMRLTMARAVAASLKETHAAAQVIVISDYEEEPVPSTSKATPATASSATPQPTTVVTGFLADRAQMEKERRERARKYRQAAGLKDDDDGSDTDEVIPTTIPATSSTSSKPAAPNDLFFHGELRPTAVAAADPRLDGKPTFRLTQALGNVRISY